MRRLAVLYLIVTLVALSACYQDMSHTVGYFVTPSAPIAPLLCSSSGSYSVTEYSKTVLYCKETTSSWVGVGCTSNSNSLVVTSGKSRTSKTCDDGCATVMVVETWPNGGSTWTMNDCADYLGVKTDEIATIYRSSPTNLPAAFTDATYIHTATVTASMNAEPKGGAGGNNDKKSNTGVIVGAVVGSVVGLGLILFFFLYGIRLGRKKAAADGERGMSRGKTLIEAVKVLPRPALVWTKPPNNEAFSAELPGEPSSTIQVEPTPTELPGSPMERSP